MGEIASERSEDEMSAMSAVSEFNARAYESIKLKHPRERWTGSFLASWGSRVVNFTSNSMHGMKQTEA